ncbi:MAG: DUF1905 domain-containing protein [Phaeodactylibacter sp.]|nr:DUF1905 domain-containing protein [Phaeodactylibacter sp.]
MQYTLEKFGGGMHYIRIPAEEAAQLKARFGSSRLICLLNNSVEFHCALMPKKEGGFYINIGKAICEKAGVKKGDTLSVAFLEDSTAYQFELPDAFAEVFHTDPEAAAVFSSLPDGRKRGLLYLVNSVKSVDKKIERALRIAEQLKAGVTNPREILKK